MTMIVPQGSLDIQRFINAESFPHVALILPRTRERVVGDGGAAETSFVPADAADAVRCRLMPAQTPEPESAIADQLSSIEKFHVVFDLQTDLEDGTRIIVSGIDRGRSWTILLAIKARLTPQAGGSQVMTRYYAEPVPAGAES